MKSYIMISAVEMETAYTEYLMKRGILPLRSTQRTWIHAQNGEGDTFHHVPIAWDARITECPTCHLTNLTYNLDHAAPAVLCNDCGACTLLLRNNKASVMADGSVVEKELPAQAPTTDAPLHLNECPHCKSKKIRDCLKSTNPLHVHCDECGKPSLGSVTLKLLNKATEEVFEVHACPKCAKFGSVMYRRNNGASYIECTQCFHRADWHPDAAQAVKAWNAG